MDHAAAKKLFLEQAAAYYDELTNAAENAPYGKVLAQAETFAVTQGRELLRKSLERVVQKQAEHEDEKKDHAVGSIDYHEAAHNIISVP